MAVASFVLISFQKEPPNMNKSRWFSLLMLMVFGIPSVKVQGADSDPVITLERTACFRTCPVYMVNILEDGTVIYEGDRFVSVSGKQTWNMAPKTVATMIQAFRGAGYFDWDETYDTQTVSDLPTVITSVTDNGITHRIV